VDVAQLNNILELEFTKQTRATGVVTRGRHQYQSSSQQKRQIVKLTRQIDPDEVRPVKVF
jgi:hypothetical protein